LMRKLGKKQLTLQLQQKLTAIPAELANFRLSIGEDGSTLIYDYDTKAERTGVATLLGELSRAGLRIRDLQTTQSSLEDIFVGLVSDRR
jgi:ABC-2 type transport system ATP-binding protein